MMYEIPTWQMSILAEEVAQRLFDKLNPQQTKHITFAEAREVLGCSDDTLTRKIKAAGIKTYSFGRGKAFDRVHLNKIK